MCLGALGLAVVGAVTVDSILGAQRAIAAFERTAAPEVVRPKGRSNSVSDPRAAAGPLETGQASGRTPLALLKVDRLDLTVPVFLGTDALTLNRGAGVVEGTSLPGENGNVVISAHRDTFFRPLKDIEVSDHIELHTPNGLHRFRVQDIFTTDPLDVSVLDPTQKSMLTLITCFPFYYVGLAPNRYIVRATSVDSTR